MSKRSRVEIVSGDPHGVTVADIERLYLDPTLEPELVHQALNMDALRQKLASRTVVEGEDGLPIAALVTPADGMQLRGPP